MEILILIKNKIVKLLDSLLHINTRKNSLLDKKSFYYFTQGLLNYTLPTQTELDSMEKNFNGTFGDSKYVKYNFIAFKAFIGLYFLGNIYLIIKTIIEVEMNFNNIIQAIIAILSVTAIYFGLGYYIWPMVKNLMPTQNLGLEVKQTTFELIRQSYSLEKLIYLPPNMVKQVMELDLIKDIFKNNAEGKVEISEVICCKIDDNNRPFLLADVKFTTNDTLKTVKHFLVFLSKNPDQHFGNTASFSNAFWKMKFGHKVETESIDFDKKFKTISENQVEARLALKTNVMADMINLENFAPRKNLFYFHHEAFIICIEKEVDPFEIHGYLRFNDIRSSARNIYKDLNIGINIFQEFWLNRKSWKG
jgi:hypothetical protein